MKKALEFGERVGIVGSFGSVQFILPQFVVWLRVELNYAPRCFAVCPGRLHVISLGQISEN